MRDHGSGVPGELICENALVRGSERDPEATGLHRSTWTTTLDRSTWTLDRASDPSSPPPHTQAGYGRATNYLYNERPATAATIILVATDLLMLMRRDVGAAE